MTPEELVAWLVRSIPSAAASSAESSAALGPVLVAALARARAAWPQLVVEDATFVTAIAAGVREAADVVAAIAELALEDLYLAQACATGAAPAIAGFSTTCDGAIAGALRQMGLAADVVDELSHEVRTKLLVAVGGPPKIATYSGRAALASWVRTVATRAAVDRIRAHSDVASDDVLEQLPDAADDPELVHLRATYGAELKQAFEEALATLEVRERNVLRHHFIDRLSIDEIGALYGVHKTTAFRWLEAARTALSKRTRDSLQRRIRILPAELDSIVRLVQSHVDLSLSRVLA